MYTIVVAWRALLMSSMNSENRNKEAEETVRLVVVLWVLYKPSLGWTNDNVAIAADTWVSAHGTVACASFVLDVGANNSNLHVHLQ